MPMEHCLMCIQWENWQKSYFQVMGKHLMQCVPGYNFLKQESEINFSTEGAQTPMNAQVSTRKVLLILNSHLESHNFHGAPKEQALSRA